MVTKAPALRGMKSLAAALTITAAILAAVASGHTVATTSNINGRQLSVCIPSYSDIAPTYFVTSIYHEERLEVAASGRSASTNKLLYLSLNVGFTGAIFGRHIAAFFYCIGAAKYSQRGLMSSRAPTETRAMAFLGLPLSTLENSRKNSTLPVAAWLSTRLKKIGTEAKLV